MSKKIILAIMIITMAFVCVACPFVGTAEHRRAHFRVIKQDFSDMHRFVDRHVWGYDWDNPHYN